MDTYSVIYDGKGSIYSAELPAVNNVQTEKQRPASSAVVSNKVKLTTPVYYF